MGAALQFDAPSRIAIPAPAGYSLLRAHDSAAGYEVTSVDVILLEIVNVFDAVELREVVGVGVDGDVSGDSQSALQTPAGQVVASDQTFTDAASWVAALKERDTRYTAVRAARAARVAAEGLV